MFSSPFSIPFPFPVARATRAPPRRPSTTSTTTTADDATAADLAAFAERLGEAFFGNQALAATEPGESMGFYSD
jgi:hypothetical protein